MADPWSKIWWSWYSSRSHADLSGIALALGSPLMLMCKASTNARHRDDHSPRDSDAPRDGQPYDRSDAVCARQPNGRPVTVTAIARAAHFSASEVEAALQELIDAGTVYVSADGAYGFYKFWTYQESESAGRQRKHRSKDRRDDDGHGDGQGDAHGNGHGARDGDGHGDDKTSDGRGEKAEGENSERQSEITRARVREASAPDRADPELPPVRSFAGAERRERALEARKTFDLRLLPHVKHELKSFFDDWAWIGERPAAELAKVLDTIAASDYAQRNWQVVDPTHIRKHWHKYAAGREPGKSSHPVEDAAPRAPSPKAVALRDELAGVQGKIRELKRKTERTRDEDSELHDLYLRESDLQDRIPRVEARAS
jgi:hypothetical protein